MKTLDYDINHHQIIFIGESIHGVSEFTLFKHQFIKTHVDQNWICFFEADYLGMRLSRSQGDCAEKILQNFPLGMRTRETFDLLTWLVEHGIPYHGIDNIPRRLLSDYPTDWMSIKSEQDLEYQKLKITNNLFEWREEEMAKNIINTIDIYGKNNKALIMLHNMHIKNKGSHENSNLRLRSVKERIDARLLKKSISIAQVALRGTAINNDITPFHFCINDAQSVESLAMNTGNIYNIYSATDLPDESVAYHHAFERENISAKEQYEWIVVFRDVNPPKIYFTDRN